MEQLLISEIPDIRKIMSNWPKKRKPCGDAVGPKIAGSTHGWWGFITDWREPVGRSAVVWHLVLMRCLFKDETAKCYYSSGPWSCCCLSCCDWGLLLWLVHQEATHVFFLYQEVWINCSRWEWMQDRTEWYWVFSLPASLCLVGVLS